MDEPLKQALTQKLSVALWPTAGKALGLGRNATYAAAHRGDITVNRFGAKMTAPTAPLRRQLGLEDGKTAVAEWAKARTYSSIAAEMAADATAKERLNNHGP